MSNTTTYSNKSGAKRGAVRQGLNLDNLDFVKNEEGRWTWVELEAQAEEAQPEAPAAEEAQAEPQVEAPVEAKPETGEIPKPTIPGQGRLEKRLQGGERKTTKAGQVRALIAKHYDVENRNVEECIALIQQNMGFGRNLARIYFANNLPKVFAE